VALPLFSSSNFRKTGQVFLAN